MQGLIITKIDLVIPLLHGLITLFLHDFSKDNRKVVLGVHSLSANEDTKQVFEILELHNNPNYRAENFDNDIALIKVISPML